MKHIHIITLTIILLHIVSLQTIDAQIVIGDNIPPESYSVIQIEGKKGMRLPRITETDKNSLDNGNILTANPKSIGLTIYNETKDVIEYWNGDKWIALKSDMDAANGLQSVWVGSNKEIRLGGTLTKTTNIDLNNKRLNIKNSATAGLGINTSVLNIKDKDINMAGNLYSVNNIFKIQNNITTLSPLQKFAVNNNTLAMNNNNGTITGYLRYADGTQSVGYLLTCDTQGKAYWEPLRPIGAISEGTIDDNKTFESANAIVSDIITLPPGQWMIFAKYTGKTPSANMMMYHWITLIKRKTGNSNPWSAVTNAGSTPEQLAINGSETYSTPSFVYYLNISERSDLAIQAGSSNTNNSTTYVPDGGKSYFYALRIDMPE